MGKKYRVIAASVAGLGNRVFYEGDEKEDSCWSPGRAAELEATGFLQEVTESREIVGTVENFNYPGSGFAGFSAEDIGELISAYKGGFLANPLSQKVVDADAVILDSELGKIVPIDAIVVVPGVDMVVPAGSSVFNSLTDKIVPIDAIVFDPEIHMEISSGESIASGADLSKHAAGILPGGIGGFESEGKKEYPPIEEMSRPQIIDELDDIGRRTGTTIDYDPKSHKTVLYSLLLRS